MERIEKLVADVEDEMAQEKRYLVADMKKLAETILADAELIEQGIWPRMHTNDIGKLGEIHGKWMTLVAKMQYNAAIKASVK